MLALEATFDVSLSEWEMQLVSDFINFIMADDKG